MWHEIFVHFSSLQPGSMTCAESDNGLQSSTDLLVLNMSLTRGRAQTGFTRRRDDEYVLYLVTSVHCTKCRCIRPYNCLRVRTVQYNNSHAQKEMALPV